LECGGPPPLSERAAGNRQFAGHAVGGDGRKLEAGGRPEFRDRGGWSCRVEVCGGRGGAVFENGGGLPHSTTLRDPHKPSARR
ncbi:MAG: hypothetical protein KF791_14200, partial [Verrucomicrobiae bacterium]|nr:hypothetical protein [Verrucomicrobiae bacterium]